MSAVSNDEPWVGRIFDLVGAYRQCAVKPTSKRYAHIIVQKPNTLELVGFRMKALPFGSVRSVHAFLRISHSLWYVLVKEFKILLTNYFDDFVAASPTSESNSITSWVHMYFKLLGWAFSESGDKAPPFSTMFQALGVNIDVSTLHAGLVKLGNTENRRKELIEFLDLVLSKGQMTKHEALRLRDGFSSLLEMFWESAHWQPFRTMPTPPEVAHFQVMQSWLSVCTEPCLVLAAPVNSNLLQQNHGSSRQTLVMMLMVAVLQRVLVQCSSFQQGNQFFSSHKGCLM